jgi:two-component system, OmpR family, alkaline phosphatase synthesis response regulator PhoP
VNPTVSTRKVNVTHKILICDDEPYIRLLIEQTLEDLEEQGVEIVTASNGAEALEIVKEERPALVFLDVMMPRISGFEVCRAIKFDLHLNDVYVVILTAKGQTIDRALGEQVGADAYMTKPFDPDEMVNLAKKTLGL